MINLIMGGFPDHYDHWKPFSQNNGEFSFLLSRMFENTSDGIRKKLSPLSSNVLSYLEKLPTIFMSEAYQIEEQNLIMSTYELEEFQIFTLREKKSTSNLQSPIHTMKSKYQTPKVLKAV